ncbi:1-deoxy-D-xylulose-5-phosphate synthase [Streptomyces antibioticus]|uniref:1-deoxy-D-xylulose-5-phosphate synthase n=1 Tax=Streptomyces antibioticus TaxID=1890 RepID=UPI00224DD1F7|nr:1-deoxy-D-xylulose-5-phosphate synthase [Streptomyces antibioticus]MCX5167484.1 1-deoxy-D-xylulose-5-phosphate synthase [Streptomyces antibioticus]
MELLERVKSPADLRGLDPLDLDRLADEIRALLIERVTRNGGHLGPNLGVVELTIALHRVFDSPRDSLVWDTGHQAYVHKLLTGRAADFATLRTRGGMSGYPSRAESEHDLVENSHASTALSYADGLAHARQTRGDPGHVVAVIGDGALTGGMSWEAVNNIAAAPGRPLVVVINDNARSYAPTVGGLAQHLAALRTSRGYEEFLERAKYTLQGVPAVGGTVYRALHGAKKGLKDFLTPQALYEDLGLKYLGPVDGHDREAVEAALRRARAFGGSVVVHCITEKGRGYAPAEEDTRDRFHAVRAAPVPGRPAGSSGPTWTAAFGEELLAQAERRPDVVALTAAMLEPAGLLPLQRALPARVVDVGIAEQHAVTCAAGMAMGGLHPVVCVYATFLNRAFDQVIMDVALHRLPVTFVLDRAGITGDDGASHNGVWDLAALQAVPGLRIAAPRDRTTLRRQLDEALGTEDAPTLLRYPKGTLPAGLPALDRITGPEGTTSVDVLARTGEDALLVAVGALAGACLAAAQDLAELGIGCTVVDPGWVKPVPRALVELAGRFDVVVTAEDGLRTGGVGETLAAALRDARTTPRELRTLGVPTGFLEHAPRAELLDECGLSGARIAEQVRRAVTDAAGHPPLKGAV